MVEYVTNLAGRLGHWGYVIIFLVVMLECQPFFGLFMAGETLVLISGFLAAQGVFDLDALIVIIASAAIVGDTIGYELGRYLGRAWLLRYGRWFGVREAQLERVYSYFERHGGKSVFFSHFMHVLRAMMPFMAGSSRMRYVRFVFYNSVGCILWASIFALLGYFFGESWHLVQRWIGRASAIVGAFLLMVIALGGLWRWLVRHESDLKQRWQKFLERPRVAAFRRRFAPQIRFLQDRLSPQGYLGLHLTVGMVVIVLGCWWFGGIVEDLLTHDPLVVVDQQVSAWFHEHATDEVTRVARAVTFFGSTAFLTAASIAVALFFVCRRYWYRLLAFVLTMGGGGLLNVLLKHIFQRQRPVFENPLVTLSSFGFPSGHTMGSTLFYGSIALSVAMYAKHWRTRVLALLIAFLIIVLIGFTRIYLGAHYLSDVMGAMAAGVAWLAACETAVEIMRRRKMSCKKSEAKT